MFDEIVSDPKKTGAINENVEDLKQETGETLENDEIEADKEHLCETDEKSLVKVDGSEITAEEKTIFDKVNTDAVAESLAENALSEEDSLNSNAEPTQEGRYTPSQCRTSSGSRVFGGPPGVVGHR